MRILLANAAYLPAIDYGGPVAKLATLASALRDLGHEPEVWTADFDFGRGRVPPGRRLVDGVPVRYLRRLAAYHWSPVVPQVVVAAGRSRFDIGHCFGMRDGLTHLLAMGLVRSSTPYVVETVGMHAPVVRGAGRKRVFDRVLGNRYLEGAVGLVATSERERRALSGATTLRVWLRYNPVPAPTRLSGGKGFRAELRIPPGAPVVGWLGRICLSKGLDLLVDAATRLPGAHLVLAGPDDRDGAQERLRRAIAASGAAERVHVVGPLWGDDKARFLHALDAFALPSLTENFGNAAAEAAAAGLPVVISDQCGAADLLAGLGAATVVPLDVSAMSAALAVAVAGPRPEAGPGTSAEAVRRALSPESVARRQVEIYEEALEAVSKPTSRS